jgi:hypothetical protein
MSEKADTTPELTPEITGVFKELVVAQLAMWDVASHLEDLLEHDINLDVLGDVTCGFDDACDVRELSHDAAADVLRAFLGIDDAE